MGASNKEHEARLLRDNLRSRGLTLTKYENNNYNVGKTAEYVLAELLDDLDQPLVIDRRTTLGRWLNFLFAVFVTPFNIGMRAYIAGWILQTFLGIGLEFPMLVGLVILAALLYFRPSGPRLREIEPLSDGAEFRQRLMAFFEGVVTFGLLWTLAWIAAMLLGVL